MPKRNDIQKILLIGSGPIVIGQACEFDYSGTQACKALKEEGYSVILVNSNPATIMTDPDMADRTYIEPLTFEYLTKIIEKERPDAMLPTVGGQTALNLAVELDRRGTLKQYGVELIGAKVEAIRKAEDRDLFKQSMESIGLDLPRSAMVHNEKEAEQAIEQIGFPAILRPSFTLGGTGGTPVHTPEEYMERIKYALDASPVRSVLVEQSLIHWKEFELEIMRDLADNVVIICSIENFDPMGIHTGDSITIAPAQTLTDKEYQLMRTNAIKIIREIGVETGGSNIQFAVDPKTGKQVIIEMNPRVSRSSALASKATGFPIAKIATKLAVGYTLDEIPNDITRETYASFEPTIDYCVVKFPRFSFEKFHVQNPVLHTQMQSVGEVMAIGRTFKESLQKAIRSLETGTRGFEELPDADDALIREKLKTPNAERIWFVAEGFRRGFTVVNIYNLSGIDPWFLWNIWELIEWERGIVCNDNLTGKDLREAKQLGFSDDRLGQLTGTDGTTIRKRREQEGIYPVYKRVDTCAAEFVAYTPYLYSTYEQTCESNPTDKKKIMILGSGPNRIGQGVEFDYCCVHASYALREDGFETIMVNCNPETVSTDYDTSDRLYFEPLNLEDILSIIRIEKPDGVIVQFGGQTPLKLALALEKERVPIIGTSPDSIDLVEDRKRFKHFLEDLGFQQPKNGTARTIEEAIGEANNIGFPVVVRPSYVLGGQAMEIVYDEESLKQYMKKAMLVSEDRPVLIDQFLADAIEFDVDAISDGETVVVGGIMEHVEEAGIHSGDSACMIPPRNASDKLLELIRHQTIVMSKELNVRGLINIQFAIQGNELFILEVNPRASRTIPFVSKSIGVPLAKLAARVMAGKTLKELGFVKERSLSHISVKESVLPFNRFPDVDPLLGPEMKSTGEVMGIDRDFASSFAKASIAAGSLLPKKGKVFISVMERDKPKAADLARRLHKIGFQIIATKGTAAMIGESGVIVDPVNKMQEGSPHIVDYLSKGEIHLVINTTFGKQSIQDSYMIRRTALMRNVPYCTTIQAGAAVVEAIEKTATSQIEVKCLQEYHAV